jgi:hypothetical protein
LEIAIEIVDSPIKSMVDLSSSFFVNVYQRVDHDDDTWFSDRHNFFFLRNMSFLSRLLETLTGWGGIFINKKYAFTQQNIKISIKNRGKPTGKFFYLVASPPDLPRYGKNRGEHFFNQSYKLLVILGMNNNRVVVWRSIGVNGL